MVKNKVLLTIGLLFSLTSCSFDIGDLLNNNDNDFFNEQPYATIEDYNSSLSSDEISNIESSMVDVAENCLGQINESHHYYYDEAITSASHLKQIAAQSKSDYEVVSKINIDDSSFNIDYTSTFTTTESIAYENEISKSDKFTYFTSYTTNVEVSDSYYTHQESETSGKYNLYAKKTMNLYEKYKSIDSAYSLTYLKNIYKNCFSNLFSDFSSCTYYNSHMDEGNGKVSDILIARNSSVSIISSKTINGNLIRKRLETVVTYYVYKVFIYETIGDTMIGDCYYYLNSLDYSLTYYANGNDDGKKFKQSKIYDQYFETIGFKYNNLNQYLSSKGETL